MMVENRDVLVGEKEVKESEDMSSCNIEGH